MGGRSDPTAPKGDSAAARINASQFAGDALKASSPAAAAAASSTQRCSRLKNGKPALSVGCVRSSQLGQPGGETAAVF